MRKILLALFLAFFLFALASRPSGAEAPVADESAQLRVILIKPFDIRVSKLEAFLEKYNSPLAPFAAKFVSEADKYGLDWRLLPAISGVESTFGKQIPYGSFNAYGWAGGNYRFASWENSIEVVSAALRAKYLDKGAVTVAQIGRRYCPPNPAWAGKVRFFVNKIDSDPLALSLKL